MLAALLDCSTAYIVHSTGVVEIAEHLNTAVEVNSVGSGMMLIDASPVDCQIC